MTATISNKALRARPPPSLMQPRLLLRVAHLMFVEMMKALVALSLIGAFTEVGPFFIGGDINLRRNNASWNKASNLLFIESPVGVGFSYSTLDEDKDFNDEKTAANDMFTFLMRWYEKFPEFKSRDLFIAGESYAGHYIPQLADVLLNHNKNSTGFKFPLKGITIGNPTLKITVDTESTNIYSWSHGVISDELFHTIINSCDSDKYTSDGIRELSWACQVAMEKGSKAMRDYIVEYDVLTDKCYPKLVEQRLQLKVPLTVMSEGTDACMNDELQLYFSGSSEVKDEDKKAKAEAMKNALHVDTSVNLEDWKICSDLNYSFGDRDINILPYLKRIIEQKIPVWIFSGDQDASVPFLSTQVLVQELAQELKYEVTVPHAYWFHNEQVAGWTTEYGDLLKFTIVRGAGHMVPLSQPARAYNLFKSFLKRKPLHTTLPNMYS